MHALLLLSCPEAPGPCIDAPCSDTHIGQYTQSHIGLIRDILSVTAPHREPLLAYTPSSLIGTPPPLSVLPPHQYPPPLWASPIENPVLTSLPPHPLCRYLQQCPQLRRSPDPVVGVPLTRSPCRYIIGTLSLSMHRYGFVSMR